ncbi:MAG: CAP domain-containing protein, partial [bacterium]|nr:CAP domain-containing protein [bacterium]
MKRDILCLFVFTFLLLINLSSFSEETIRELKSVPGECLNVVNTVRQENNLPELISDPILNESAKDYLYYFIKKHGTDFRNSGDSIDNEMQKSILAENLFTDVISAVYSELFITTNPKKIYALLKENQKTVKKEYNRFGIAVLEYKEFYYFYFSFSEKKTEIQINSNKFDLFDRFHFDVQILDTINYRDPSVYITLPDGTVSEMKDITVIGNSFTVDFDRFKENGIYTFEIIME